MNHEINFDTVEAQKDKGDKKLILIIYDISDNKRRVKMAKLLESYGYRIQKSAFEALIGKRKLNVLVNSIEVLISKEDCVKIYILKGNCETYTWGNLKDIEEDEILFI